MDELNDETIAHLKWVQALTADARSEMEKQILAELAAVGIVDPIRGDRDPLLQNIGNTRLLAIRSIDVVAPWLLRAVDEQDEVAGAIVLLLQWAPPRRAPEIFDLLVEAWDRLGPTVKRSGAALTRESVGSSLYRLAPDSRFARLLELIQAPDTGIDAYFLYGALGRMKSHRAEAIDVLVAACATAEFRWIALDALAKLRAEEARPEFERDVREGDWEERRRAKRALARIDKVAARGA
ncbi:hypothetical protein GCM10027515_13830 [Schumannella luteola]|uniref:HEAT repeat protein n=1 Tax=Schumannella luteola TaxID=472059 RepID=A0A852YJ80_9MICO|nr:hypothetical protein [Schumannella luteola]NYG97829.1 HEAT repeat protein [Schumannella luteola]TPX02911.1 hypothetical protein FJ656_19815 [Schumannella luteola]